MVRETMKAPRLLSVWFGGREYERMARVLEATALRHCAGWQVDVLRIDPAAFAASAYAKPGHVFNTQKMAAWRDAVMEAEDGDRLLLIDADTFITAPLDPVWDLPFDMAYTTKPGARFPFNSGVVFLRVNEASRRFVEGWWQENLRLLGDANAHKQWRTTYGGINQAALGSMLNNPRGLGLDALELPCAEWNCEDSAWAGFGPHTRIVHVKSALRKAIFQGSHATLRRHKVAVMPLSKRWRELETSALTEAA